MNETALTHPTPPQKTPLILHLNALLLRPRQPLEKLPALSDYIPNQRVRQPRFAEIQKAHVEQGGAQVGEELRFCGGVQRGREGEDGERCECLRGCHCAGLGGVSCGFGGLERWLRRQMMLGGVTVVIRGLLGICGVGDEGRTRRMASFR